MRLYAGNTQVTQARCTRSNTKMPLTGKQPALAAVVHMTQEGKMLLKKLSHYLWTAYCAMSGNYVAIVTVLVVVILSFLLPDISQKIHATNELKTMKKVLDKMSHEVKQAEVACLTVADEICSLHSSMHDDGTETVSISPEKKLKICQSAPAIACELHSRNQSKLKKKSVSFGVFSFPIVTRPIRKSRLCRTSTPIHSTLKKK
ncbi:uncharacterized protein LOC113494778 isoform X2 [Trichoplusia ni]|uniref:Uncharacterized protein LOC113494778 isoform X2 n=1 Tax=Trichoplusia ni TaxID=7111 RepID=A0A7E5VL81_TRINI|nr:uncharacterized protein LOC113494778 isoform X2 [Trichoplusia ni]